MLGVVPLALALAARACGALADEAKGTADVVFMADIGHARENLKDLTSPWPMSKAAGEGAFSLYEGLRDYVENQGARPQAVLVVGDVAYGGGDARVLNHTRDAFQKYLKGTVSASSVFPAIGNHDIHYLGCSKGEWRVTDKKRPCYYGSAEHLFRSEPQLTFQQWRSNWLAAFPGLSDTAIAPPASGAAEKGVGAWVTPNRYNLNLDEGSSVYFIVGLLTGSTSLRRTDDTPRSAKDAAAKGGKAIECAFLRDSLAHGRRLGKTVFVYLTHHFKQSCDDWSLIRQLDVWISGHKHNYWQNIENGGVVVQEQRNYPTRIMVGNGGFDEGQIDVVSFGHLREEVYGEGEARVRVHLDIKDTCVSAETCPSSSVQSAAHCWAHCKKEPGGFDGGGGPRKATPSKHGFGFVVDAPRRQPGESPATAAAPFKGTWKVQVGQGGVFRWLGLGNCTVKASTSARCLVSTDKETEAAVLTFYDGLPANLSARIALEDECRGPVLIAEKGAMARVHGFWDVQGVKKGVGLMRPSDGWVFKFAQADSGWKIEGVAWRSDDPSPGSQLVHQMKNTMDLQLHAASLPPSARSTAKETVVVI